MARVLLSGASTSAGPQASDRPPREERSWEGAQCPRYVVPLVPNTKRMLTTRGVWLGSGRVFRLACL